MSLAGWITVGFAALTVAGIYGIVRHHSDPYREKPKRGTAPGHGDTLVYARERTAFFGNGNEDAAGRVFRVPQDPQVYARGMVPGRARQDEKR